MEELWEFCISTLSPNILWCYHLHSFLFSFTWKNLFFNLYEGIEHELLDVSEILFNSFAVSGNSCPLGTFLHQGKLLPSSEIRCIYIYVHTQTHSFISKLLLLIALFVGSLIGTFAPTVWMLYFCYTFALSIMFVLFFSLNSVKFFLFLRIIMHKYDGISISLIELVLNLSSLFSCSFCFFFFLLQTYFPLLDWKLHI